MIAEPSMPDRRPSPGLSLELNSNNPFRNRATSPAIPSPALRTPTSSASRPMSRNPFLQTFEAEFNKQAKLIDMNATMKESPKKASFGDDARQLFRPMDRSRHFASRFANYPALRQDNLTLDDGDRRRPPPQARGPPPRGGTLPSSGHRPSRSEEEDRAKRQDYERRDDRRNERRDERRDERSRGPPRGPPRPSGTPGSRREPPRGSPHRRETSRRARRNSESSMIDKGSLDPFEERRRRERRKERDERTRDPKSRSGKVRKPHGLDIIDKLDVSGIYGPSMIHHDGPYDAVQPHRNREKDKRAPMSAFPVGSANNALGGSGPVNDKIDLDKIHGRGAEGFTDFGGAANTWGRPEIKERALTFGPKERSDIVHGEETYGLGTSTFLDGAPASRTAIQQNQTENQKAAAEGGLGRKKSIAQRFRGLNQPRRDYGADRPRITSSEARYGSAQSPQGPLTTGGSLTASKANEKNPFFDDYDEAYEKKGAAINVAQQEGAISPGGRNPLARAVTADSIGSPNESKPQGGGFLNRVKSLKGGRR
ncbi:Pal1-domain-containing protein, partial [Bimuria novae-zelandiae CBS 107.79]